MSDDTHDHHHQLSHSFTQSLSVLYSLRRVTDKLHSRGHKADTECDYDLLFLSSVSRTIVAVRVREICALDRMSISIFRLRPAVYIHMRSLQHEHLIRFFTARISSHAACSRRRRARARSIAQTPNTSTAYVRHHRRRRRARSRRRNRRRAAHNTSTERHRTSCGHFAYD